MTEREVSLGLYPMVLRGWEVSVRFSSSRSWAAFSRLRACFPLYPGLYGVLASFPVKSSWVTRVLASRDRENCPNHGPWAGVTSSFCQKVRNGWFTLLVGKRELFRFRLSLYNSAFCSGFRCLYVLFPVGEKVIPGCEERCFSCHIPGVLRGLSHSWHSFLRTFVRAGISERTD